MKRIGKLLFAAAVGISLPAMAIAQRGPGDMDRQGNQNRDGAPRGFAGGRGPDAFRNSQPQRVEQSQRPDRPDFAQRPDRAPGNAGQDFNRGRPSGAGFAGRDQARGEDRRGYDARPDYRGNDDRRRFEDNRRYDDRSRWGDRGRPGNDRWVGSNWRQDQRYDWRGYRDYNRDQFRIGRYEAPRGWSYSYRRYSIGAVLPSLLWGSSYWLDDPWAYRLPPAYGPYRWVRYYDDVLLIDVRSGRVVDVIPGFFW
ncbi:RcnB family protein [Sphingomonas sp.]|uniref:RcnB family protein n=1 Tax=Sphingomonas sp. TaxID=28214 RepID=UPI000DB64B24|nr:RcnB family protein [Sphingomonas sp.]PZU11950.1 MAG: ATP-dependent RNA helicase [Sphingomonas sp.]